MEQRAAAFFDLDRTLMRENSGQLYALHEFKQGRLSLRQLVQSSYWLLLHHLALLDVEVAYQKAASHWRGSLGSDVRDMAASWFERDVAHRLTPGGKQALEMHRARSEPTVLLTNTSGYIAMAAAACWQVDFWLANVIPTDAHGRITGELDAPLCFGEGKVTRAEAWAREHHVSLEQSYFYSDSISDVPMLARVGHPRVVNPDPMLRRYAKKRSWPIVDWAR
ncbi:MAG: family hydrolase [Myxococcaceae bacterium]|nr:family hydrolase [Myxococcaceae bacterium]